MNYQELNGKALARGVGLYVALYAIHIVLLPALVGKSAASGDYQIFLYALSQLLGLMTCLAPGYLAGRISGRHGFVHGGIVGGVSTLATALLAMLWAVTTGARFYGLDTLPFWLMINVFLGAVAGIYATNMEETTGESEVRKVARQREF